MTAEIDTIRGDRVASRNAESNPESMEILEPDYTIWQIQCLLGELEKASRGQKMAAAADIARCFHRFGSILFEIF